MCLARLSLLPMQYCSTLVEDTPLLCCPTKKLQRCSVNKATAVLQSALTGCRAAAAAAATAAGLIMLVSACHVCHDAVTLSSRRPCVDCLGPVSAVF